MRNTASVICDRCGGHIAKTELPSHGPSATITAKCCGRKLSRGDFEALQERQKTHFLAINGLQLKRMLGKDDEWLRQHRNELAARLYFNGAGVREVFPLQLIRRYAADHGIKVRPLASGKALWVPKAIGKTAR